MFVIICFNGCKDFVLEKLDLHKNINFAFLNSLN